MTIGEKIALIRYQRGISLIELSYATGLSLGMLSNIESGYIEPSEEIVKLVCHGLDFGANEMLQTDMMLARRGATQIPIYDHLEDVGLPGYINAKPRGNVYVSNMLIEKGEHFIVKVDDSSMNASRIQENDYILVRRQLYIPDHEIAVLQIGEQKPMVRSVVGHENETLLFAKNYSGSYPPIRLASTDFIRIIGKVVRVIANLQQYNSCMKLMQSDHCISEELLKEYGVYKPISIHDFEFEK